MDANGSLDIQDIRLRPTGLLRVTHICAGPGADSTVDRCRIGACGCQTGPHFLLVANCRPESTCLRGKLERSIESCATADVNLHQCDHQGFLLHGADAPLRLLSA